METIIKKVHLTSSIFLKLDYSENNGDVRDNFKRDSNQVIHEDLADAIQGMVPHFVLLTEMKKKSDVAKIIDLKQLDETLLSKFRVTGINIDENKGTISYTIDGYKILNTGKTVAFSSPKVRRMTKTEDTYDFFDEMEQQIDLIKEEVLEYMNGKSGIREQTTMEFDEFSPETDEVEAEAVEQFEEEPAA